MPTIEFHVLPHAEQWQLSRNGRRTALFATKQEAIEAACDLAQTEELSAIVVHDPDGHVQGTTVTTAE
ncbi:DUF2188 domain-containing protein [Microlunatus soli]|uniref:DUF2188 domain-containing protein n=1 Tax=Microlunatus soli TaxID=630515 RepID=A0A1H1N424_9ACTN|nr:DUF2188 domain-containing protein [Microlunatus soli]SDR93667.1 hypothetical protein SAMN04489812_0370 [Microlunatus soli]